MSGGEGHDRHAEDPAELIHPHGEEGGDGEEHGDHPGTGDDAAPLAMRCADIRATLVVGLAAAYATAAGFTLAAVFLVAVCGVVMLGAGITLFEITAGDARRQVLWMRLGLVLSAPTSLLLFVLISSAAPGLALFLGIIAGVLSLSIPLATAIAVINPRVVDVRAVTAHLTVLTIMLAFGAALYVGTETTILALTGDIPPVACECSSPSVSPQAFNRCCAGCAPAWTRCSSAAAQIPSTH